MTSKFREFFGGSGNLNGKAPDIAMSPGLNWGIAGSAASLTRSANRVTSTSNVNTNDAGSEEYGNRIGTTYAGALTTGTVSIKFTTGPSVGANADGHRGFSLILGYGTAGNNIEIYASGNTSGVWTLGLDGSSTGITVAANTTYTGVFTFSSGSQSITMFGQTVSGGTLDTTGGNNYIWLVVGSTTYISELDIYDAGGPTPDVRVTSDITLPMLTLSAYFGGGASLTLPMLTLNAAAHDSTGENAVDYVIPMLTVQADFGATVDAILPMLVLDAQAIGTALLTADLTLPMITLDAAGTGSPWSITADITLPMLTLGAHFGGGAAVTLPMLTVDISTTAGGILSAEITLPMLTVDIQVTLQNYGWADITLPMIQPVGSMTFDIVLPMLTLDAVVSAIVTATYEAYAINLKPSGENPVNEVTRYTNFPFTQVIRYKNAYYGVAADGLYLLEGTTDYASPAPAPIRFNWKTAQTDFKIALEKTVVSAYFGGVMGPADTVTLFAGNKESDAYKYTTPRGNDIQNHRQKFGRGIKARYFALGVSGSGPLELDGVEFNLNTLTRRI